MIKLLCVGHSALDAIYTVPAIPTLPTKVLATAFIESGGGMAANASVAAKRLGAEVHYCGRLGTDPTGERIIAQLVAEGVGVDLVRRIEHCQSPIAAILVGADGERLVCIYNDPALDPSPDWLPLQLVPTFHAVLTDVRWPAGARRVLDAARAASVPSVFDGDVGDPEALRDLCSRCDYAIFSTPGLTLATETHDPLEGLRRAQKLTPAVVGVTLGEQGLLWLEGGRERRDPAPRITAVDTLAAGDVFHAAFAIAIGEGKTVTEAARFANAAAAIKCTRPGGRLGAPTRAEVDALLATRAR
jgi:sulfofructose kinase